MKTKHFTFFGAIVLFFLTANYFVFYEREPTGGDLEIMETETETKVDVDVEAAGNISEQSYCEDLRNRSGDQEDRHIIVESIPDFKILNGQRISGCVYKVSGSYGGWAPFEAQVGSFHLQDTSSAVVSSGPLSVAGEDWMTRAMNSESLQFSGIINFDQKDMQTGVLLLRNENASGETQLDRTISLPIIF